MNQRSFIVAVAASLALAAPVGSATWMSHGDYEPNTVLDDLAFNWEDPPAPGVKRIYFNAYSTMSDGATGGGMNPNAGVLRSHIEPAGNEQQYAVFGLWNDCNNDGYVGHAESAWREYPTALLLDDSRCAPHESANPSCWTTVSPPGSPCPAWPTNWHNVDGWVTELLVIVNAPAGGDKRVIVDANAHVWGDYGKPGVITNDAGTCPLSPLPRGSTQSTGGALSYLDCYGAVLETMNDGFEAAGDPLGLAFSDENDGTSGTLGSVSTLGDPDSGNAIVRTGNCDQPDSYAVAWPAGLPPAFYENFHQGVRNPDTGYVNPGGSIAGTVNYTRESGPFPDSASGNAVASTSNCDFEDDRGDDAFPLEGDAFTTTATNKIQSDWNFGWSVQSRGGLPLGTPLNPVGGGAGAAGGAPSDAGLEPFNAFCLICQQTEWSGISTNVAKLPQTLALRTNVDDPGADIDGAYWLTFYAYTSTSAGDVPTGVGTYGSQICGDDDENVISGFNCDASAWNKNPDGTNVEPSTVSGQYHLAKPRDRYNFLDVDCFDGSVTPAEGTTVALLPAGYGNSPCAAG